jgi:hypothetical protein
MTASVEWHVLVGRTILFERVTLQRVCTDSVVVLHGEEPALIAPRALVDAGSQPPVPELADWAQATLFFFHTWQRFLENLDIDAGWYGDVCDFNIRAQLHALRPAPQMGCNRHCIHILHDDSRQDAKAQQ